MLSLNTFDNMRQQKGREGGEHVPRLTCIPTFPQWKKLQSGNGFLLPFSLCVLAALGGAYTYDIRGGWGERGPQKADKVNKAA